MERFSVGHPWANRMMTIAMNKSMTTVAKSMTAAPVFWASSMNRYLKHDPLNRRFNIWEMQAQVDRLSPLQPTPDPLEVCFLTGQRFWYQTCLCAYSLIKQMGQYIRPVIYDDGTLTQFYIAKIRRLFPDAKIFTAAAIEAQLNRVLPVDRYPMLRSQRLSYFHLRKLTDVHVGGTGWQLVLDSDMLFFHRPQQLLDWLQQPQAPCHMMDLKNAYGYSPELMAHLAGCPIPERINVGICGLNSSTIDWDQVESWCRLLLEKEGHHYFQEQALAAMLIAQSSSPVVMSSTDYVLMPSRSETLSPRAVMHHYVDYSKPWYFRHAWRRVVKM
jgi:hypothetical protein